MRRQKLDRNPGCWWSQQTFIQTYSWLERRSLWQFCILSGIHSTRSQRLQDKETNLRRQSQQSHQRWCRGRWCHWLWTSCSVRAGTQQTPSDVGLSWTSWLLCGSNFTLSHQPATVRPENMLATYMQSFFHLSNKLLQKTKQNPPDPDSCPR